ncbi:MAG: GFA family protein [Candidatus Devosia phytovorans]|uniref:GFA family protein n=1 Tax=Candidatus Devosia phytovorans TaxID=3121372 RepID=A0AAJ5VW06_9HYPH|nr:GFA family protein [Devosia sp.]WEK05936.1 MAG: GFA family protein [Devosia sp.]
MSEKPIASCHCGRVTITLPRAPEVVVECNCSLCRRYGVLWTYFEDSELGGLPSAGETQTYAWNGKHVDFHRCSSCGCVTHWAPRAASRHTIGINARLLDPELVAAARLRHKDGAGSGKYLD